MSRFYSVSLFVVIGLIFGCDSPDPKTAGVSDSVEKETLLEAGSFRVTQQTDGTISERWIGPHGDYSELVRHPDGGMTLKCGVIIDADIIDTSATLPDSLSIIEQELFSSL